VVCVKVDRISNDMQIKYREQNGVQQLSCDNETQIRATLDSVTGGDTYSVIHIACHI
jgi:hypothetical protein